MHKFPKVLMLYSEYGQERRSVSIQNSARHLFKTRGVLLEELDGSAESNNEKRNKLWTLCDNSIARGSYPQFFAESPDSTVWLGDWDTITSLNDAHDIPPSFLYKHPEIITFTKRFKGFMKYK